jgi:hypothetical protein
MCKKIFILILLLQFSTIAYAARIDTYPNVTGDNATGNDELIFWKTSNSKTRNIIFSEFLIWLKANGLASSLNPIISGSLTFNKTSGVAGDIGMYELNSTDTDTAGFRGPASLTYSYRGKFPNIRAVAPRSVLTWTNESETGNGTSANPYIQTMDFSQLGSIPTVKDDVSLDATQVYGHIHWLSGGAKTVTLPAAVVGMNFGIYSSDATVKNIDPNGTDTIVLTTVALNAGYQIESPGAAGDFIFLVCFTANQWTAMQRSGVWISHGAD